MRRFLTPTALALAALTAAWLAWLITLPPRPSHWLVLASALPLAALISAAAARRAGAPWAAFVRDTADLHALGLVLLYALGVQFEDTHGISVDGITYFAQLRSAVFDGDLDVAREFAYLGQPPRPNHVVPVGPIVIWLPLYLIVALVDGIGRMAGLLPAADPLTVGLGLPYVRAALVSSFAIGAAGLVALHLCLRRRFAREVALVTTVLIFAATPLYWYMVYEPSMTHAASFGFVALFIAASAAWVPRGVTVRESILLGVLIGFAFLARSQEALFAIFPGLLVLTGATPATERGRAALGLAGWALVGALPFILIQLAHSYVLFSRYDYALFGAGGYIDLWRSRWADTLFSSWHGFLSWTPLAYVAVLGTIGYLKRDWRWASAALGILLVTAWVNGATQDWAGGWSLGGRRFTSVLVMLAPGLALAIEAVWRRPALALAPLAAAAIYWNYLLMVQYTAGMLPKDEPVSFGRIVRQQAELHTRSPYFYPFAFPANAWFAWREGLPIDKYDLLAPEPMRASIDLVFDKRAEKFLLDGWDVPGGDDWGSCWWIGGSPATLALRLAIPRGQNVTITVQTRTRFEEPPVRAAMALDVNGVEVGRFSAGVPDATSSTFVVSADRAAVFREGYNRFALRSLGVEKVDPADPRPPGPLASRTGSHVWPVAVYKITVE